MARSLAALAAAGTLGLAGCGYELPPEGSYYDDHIGPTLRQSCAQTTSGCHLSGGRGVAAGNLDMTSYDSLRRRTDALMAYGPYPRPLLLLKVGGPVEVPVETLDPPDPAYPEQRFVMVRTDIRHAADATLPEGSRAFSELARWLDSGFTRTGAPAEEMAEQSGGCVSGPGQASGFSEDAAPTEPALFDRFVADVQPVLVARCASSGCHGAGLADLHLSCGETVEEQRWNYWISLQHLSDPAERSEILTRPLASARGGAFHGGGDTFAEIDDPGYVAIAGWVARIASEAPELLREDEADEGYRFFVNRVEPILVRKGCMALACHSPVSVVFNLRGGAGGAFSRFARHRNYAAARGLLALESPDANQSRIVAKNLFAPAVHPAGDGILHRGGSLFEDFRAGPARPSDCEGIDADSGDLNEIPAYCVLVRWHAIERAAAVDRGDLDGDDALVRAVAWVARPPGVGELVDFDTYRPGADLRVADASVDADGALSLGAPRSLLAGCGIDARVADVRRPRASWDGTRLAFAVRTSADAPLRIWEATPDGSRCAPIDGLAAAEGVRDGVPIHDFDPAYAPDGRIVFASTRGLSHGRPTRTPAALQPNADLYVFDPEDGALVQLTFLLNQELAPGFMPDGRVIYTAEKRELDFHMLALRRQNLDGGDYHPLYASRHSLGFGAATDVSPLPDGNFVFVASPLHAPDGAGSIAVFNRTLGPDQEDRDPMDRAFLHSMSLAAVSAHHGGRGLYRSPAVLPTGRVLVSCALDVTDPAATDMDFDLCTVEPRTGRVSFVIGELGVAEVDAVALYARPNRGIVRSDGRGIDHPDLVPDATDAQVHFNDFPMIQSLMFRNTRTGRPIDARIGGFEVLRSLPPPPGTARFDEVSDRVTTDGFGTFFADRAPLGWAPLFDDGSVRVRIPGGVALSYRMTDASGGELEMAPDMPFAGPDLQREHEQYFPGERIQRSIPRRFFNDVCGGCHGSLSGRELDVGVSLDVISGASVNAARDASPIDVMGP